MTKEPQSFFRILVTGVAAGLVAGAIVGQVEKLADRLIDEKSKRREKQVREDSAHKMAGPYFARQLLGHELSEKEKRRARMVFGLSYGVMWGLIYGEVRAKFPAFSRLMGLPFAVPFFFGCDGALAPLLGISPGLPKIPWQINAKEMGNHIVWTMSAETVHRLLARSSGNGSGAREVAAEETSQAAAIMNSGLADRHLGLGGCRSGH